MILRILLLALLFEVMSAQEFYIDDDEYLATTPFIKALMPAIREEQEQQSSIVIPPPITTTEPPAVVSADTSQSTAAVAVAGTTTDSSTTSAIPVTTPTTTALTSPEIPESLINCNDFNKYKAECAKSALSIYNYTKNVPPPPVTFDDWCDSLQVIVECAKEWNAECEDASNFNEDTIAGLNHVIEFLCDDFNFVTCDETVGIMLQGVYEFDVCLQQRDGLSSALPVAFLSVLVDFFGHSERMRFRTCTMKVLTDKCSKKQAMVLQKFSTAVSFGDVYQDCDPNLVYKNCPGGDPRPSDSLVAKLTAADYIVDREDPEVIARDSAHRSETLAIQLIVFMNFVSRLF